MQIREFVINEVRWIALNNLVLSINSFCLEHQYLFACLKMFPEIQSSKHAVPQYVIESLEMQFLQTRIRNQHHVMLILLDRNVSKILRKKNLDKMVMYMIHTVLLISLLF
jgi:hypothetical protein